MVRRDTLLRTSVLSIAVLIGLAACNRSGSSASEAASADALPLTTAEAAPSAPAPSADALPAAAPAPVARVANPGDDYAYLDQAYYEGDAYEDAPPDYAFDYGGATPWAWQGDDGTEFAEPVDDGYRYYYYQPGAQWPYLIRDGGYEYGFDGPQLVVIYDSSGRVMPRSFIEARAGLAGRYLARAQGLYEAARSAGRRSVAAASWAAARPRIAAQHAQLSAARGQQSGWQAYNQAHAGAEQARWAPERDQRQAYAQRFNTWQRTNFQGAPPKPPGGRQGAPIRQAQATAPERQAALGPAAPIPAGLPPAPGQRPFQSGEDRRLAQQGPARQETPQDQARQQPQPPRLAQAQPRPAENRAFAQPAGPQHPAPAAQQPQRAAQAPPRQPAEQQRQFAEVQRHQGQVQTPAPPRPEVAAQQRVQAPPLRGVAQAPARPPMPPRPQQQAQQQRQPPHPPAQPPAARPAAKDERRQDK